VFVCLCVFLHAYYVVLLMNFRQKMLHPNLGIGRKENNEGIF